MKTLLTQNAGYIRWLPCVAFVASIGGWVVVLLAEPLDLRPAVVAGATLFALALGIGLTSLGVTTLIAPELRQQFASHGLWVVLWGPQKMRSPATVRWWGVVMLTLGVLMLLLPLWTYLV